MKYDRRELLLDAGGAAVAPEWDFDHLVKNRLAYHPQSAARSADEFLRMAAMPGSRLAASASPGSRP